MSVGNTSKTTASFFSGKSYDETYAAYVAREKASADYQRNSGNRLQRYFFGGSLVLTDIGPATTWRLWIVYEMMRIWGTNCDSPHPNSRYNKIVHNRGESDPFTKWEWGFGLLTLASLAAGAYREYYTDKNNEYLNSVEYLQKQREQQRRKYFSGNNSTLEKDNDDIKADLDKLARERWKKYQATKDPRHFKFADNIAKEANEELKKEWPRMYRWFLEKPHWILDSFYKWKGITGNYSYTFWIVWMTAAVMMGIPFVNSPVGMPLVTGIAIGISGLVYLISSKLAIAEPKTVDKDNNDKAMEQIQRENHLRLFLKSKHAIFKKKLETLLAHAHTQNAAYIETLFPKVYGKKVPAAQQAPRVNPLPKRENAFRKLFAPSKGKKMFFNIVHDFVNEATMMFFNLWFWIFVFASLVNILAFAVTVPYLSPALMALGAKYSVAASFLKGATIVASWARDAVCNPFYTAILGAAAAGLKSCFTFASQMLENKIYDKTLEAKANSAYKAHRDDVRLSNEKAFNDILAEVVELIRQVALIQQEIAAKHGNDPKNPALAMIKGYGLKEIDISKDPLAEQGYFARFKAILMSIFLFVAGAQTWIFNLRNIGLPTGGIPYLVSGIASLGMMFFAVNGPMQAFLGLAGILGVLGGSLKVALYQTTEAKKKQDDFLATLAPRIGSLRQEKDRLECLIKLYNVHGRLAAGQNINKLLDPNRPRPESKALPSQDGHFKSTPEKADARRDLLGNHSRPRLRLNRVSI